MFNKKILLTKEQVKKLKYTIIYVNSLLLLIGILHIHYNIKSYAWIHIILTVLCPPYAILYFLLIFFNFIKTKKNE